MKRKRKTGLVIFLVLLLILLGVPASLYLYLARSVIEIDPIQHAADGDTLDPADRFSVDPAENTLDIRMSTGDMALILLDNLDLEEMRQELAAYEVIYDETGFSLSEEGVCLSMDARWKDFLHLPLRLLYRTECEGEQLRLIPDKIFLGNKISLGKTILRLFEDSAAVSIRMTAYSSVFSGLCGCRSEENCLVLTAAEPLRWICRETVGNPRLTHWADYTGPFPLEELISALETQDDAVCREWLESLASGQRELQDLKNQELAYSGPYNTKVFISGESSLFKDRLFPDISAQKADSIAEEYTKLYNERREQLRIVANGIVTLYCSKMIATDGTQFINLKTSREPLSVAQFPGAEDVAQWMDTSAVTFAYGPVSETYLNITRAVKTMPKFGKTAFDTIDATQVYDPYMVFRSLAGRPVIAVEVAPGNLHLYEMSEEAYAAVVSSDRLKEVDYRYSPVIVR